MTKREAERKSQVNGPRSSMEVRTNRFSRATADASLAPGMPTNLDYERTTNPVPLTSTVAPPARILIVARPATSRAISTAIAIAGYEVHRTPDANSAVEAARRLRPHLAIVASDAPGSSSRSVAGRLRSSQANLPIIILCGSGESSTSREPDCVPDDISPVSLLATIGDQIAFQPVDGELNAR